MEVGLCGTGRSIPTLRLLESIIRECISPESFRVHFTIQEFAQSLREPGKAIEIAVLVANNPRELQAFMTIAELLDDIRTVMVLGGEADHLISQAHKLRPRFLWHADSDLAVVGRVLEKMMKGRQFPGIRDKPYASTP